MSAYTFKTRKTAYMDRPALTSTPVGRGAGARVVVIQFTDNGETTVEAMTGDGRTKNFQRFGGETLYNPTPAELTASVDRMAAILP